MPGDKINPFNGAFQLRAEEEIIAHTRIGQRRGRENARISLNLVAMIDVVFLLLIYFLTVTDFKLGEEIYRMDLPQRQPSAQLADPFELDEEPLRIIIDSSGRGDNQYVISLSGPYESPATFEDLYDFLHQQQVSEITTGGFFAANHPIIVEPSRNVRWEHAIEAFNAAAKARYTNITFSKPR